MKTASLVLCVCSATLLVAGFSGAGKAAQQKTDFDRDVQPILKAHCFQCHGDAQLAAGLDLRSRDAILKGGIDGPSVVPGNSSESILLKRILGQGGLDRMPLGFAPLNEKDTATIKAWIDEGALPGSGVGTKHWAFVSPVRPKAPEVKDKAWVRNPIDAFVLARIEKEGLRPSPEADKTTLIRRVTLDLTGLPPTPQEVDAFNDDKSKNAYEKVVDRLLKSPHFGERLALPWLDAARYADSNGFQQDGDTYQYVWRDWVVRAINADMPFDQFTIEQLAGDLLPSPTQDQLIATAFNRNHMLNGEGGAIAEEQRNVILFDRVDVTSTTWLALTMACSRCHDHKYDPISQRDYYSLMAYFNNVPESGVPPGGGQYRIAEPAIYTGTEKQVADLKNLQESKPVLEAELRAYLSDPDLAVAQAKWETAALAGVKSAETTKVEFSGFKALQQYTAESFDKAFETTFAAETTGSKPQPDAQRYEDGKVYQLSGDNTAFYFENKVIAQKAVTYTLTFGSDDGIKVWLNGKPIVSNKVTRGVVPESEVVKVELPKGQSTILLKVVNGGGIGGFTFAPYPGGLRKSVREILDMPVAKRDPVAAGKARDEFLRAANLPRFNSLRKRIADTEKSIEDLKSKMPQVMVMSDAQPRQTHIYSRGDYESPLDVVKPDTPSVLPPLPKGVPSNRLALAKWIVGPDNPLTARVQVNRYWQLLFGKGLVKTAENFGKQGEPPANPELLDWLAVEFRESGWKVKKLIKTIVMSSTYRQSSKVTKEAFDRDQDNSLLARGARFRMPSMILRDVALASSGLLNPKIGGKPVYPYQPKGIWDGLAITNERDFTYPESMGEDLYRRSIYTFWRRTAAPGNMFDSPSRQACTVRTSMTSTPMHALTTLNDPTWVEAGRALAERAMKVGGTPGAKLTEAFRLVCARRPRAEELAVLVRSFDRSYKTYKTYRDGAKAYLAVGARKPDPKLDTAELAAYASVCLAIYNLDEALTRE